MSLCVAVCLFFLQGRAFCQIENENIALVNRMSAAFNTVAEQAKGAVVYIYVKKVSNPSSAEKEASAQYFDDPAISQFFGDRQKKQETDGQKTSYAHGSGFLVSRNGYIVTNAHVVQAAKEIKIYLLDKRILTATIVGVDKKTDVALLKIEGNDFPVLPLGDSSLLKTGDWVIAVGSPFEMVQTVTAGIISATGRSSLGISEYEDFIQTDAAINPGNSGGPLIDMNGRAIGMNTAFLTQSGGYMGVGFAVPINMVKIIAERLQKDGKMTRSWLGVALRDVAVEEMQQFRLPKETTGGAYIEKVEPSSPAAAAGLQKDDILVAIDNQPISGAADLRNRVALSAPRTTVTLRYWRQGQMLSVSTTLSVKEDR